MINLGNLRGLSAILQLNEGDVLSLLHELTENPEQFVSELRIWPIDPLKRHRDVIAIKRKWRQIQDRLYRRLLLPRLSISNVCHGGVRCRSTLSNARTHIGNTFAFVTDIRGFFQSISSWRVNQFFLRQACSYEVARALTRLCTYEFHLAMGLVTSPLIANAILRPIDHHIDRACSSLGLTYTRYVDDITISGRFDLRKSGIQSIVQNIVGRHGFHLADDKTKTGRFDEDITVTGNRIKREHIDATKSYIVEVDRLIRDHQSLANGAEFAGPLLMQSELYGKVHFVCGVNSGRRRTMFSQLKAINWDDLIENASARELVQYRMRILPRSAPRPDPAEEFYMAKARRVARDARVQLESDPADAPF